DLSSNGLGERGLAGLCSALLNNNSLAKLDLSHNSITDKEAAFVCKLLENNIHLKQLILSKNAIECNDGGMESALGYNDTLEVLDLSWNRIREEGANSLTKGLYANNGLKDLDLSWNGFSDRSCQGLVTALRKNFVLEKLRLRHNRMSGRSALAILGYNPIESKDTPALLEPFLKDAIPSGHGIKDVDLSGGVAVPPQFLVSLARLQTGRLLRVTYGCVAAPDGVRQGQTSFNNRRHQLVERTFEH
uniref:Leucine-rich repeat-containing protein 45 n=1 Tax=Macrostomum lignano TaxID=282301 RepID=A0A1I8H6F4_9PLAT